MTKTTSEWFFIYKFHKVIAYFHSALIESVQYLFELTWHLAKPTALDLEHGSIFGGRVALSPLKKLLYSIVVFIALIMSTNVFADGGVGGGWESPGAGGLDSITGDGGNGGNAFFFGGAGGGGGGAGVSVGGAGGAGSYFGAGGTGGVSGTFPSGGLTSTNISGSAGSIGQNGPNAGGGGGAGGYGLIITNELNEMLAMD